MRLHLQHTKVALAALFALAGASVAYGQAYEFKRLSPGLKVTQTGQPSSPLNGPIVSLSTSEVLFGAKLLNGFTTEQVLLENTGNETLVFLQSPAVTGHASFTAGSSTCGGSLAPGASCRTDVTFSPVALSPVTGSLGFATNAPGSVHSVTLRGSGLNPELSLSSLSRTVVELAGGLPLVQLNGTGFTSDVTAEMGGSLANCTFNSATQLTCAPPSRATEGQVSVVVRDTVDGRTATLANALTYAKLDVTSLSLASLSTLGGQTLLVNGSGFMPGTTATLRGLSMTCTVTSDIVLSCVTPAAAAGTADLVVTTPAGSSVTKSGLATFVTPTTFSTLDAGKKASQLTLSTDLLTASTSLSGSFYSVFGTLPKSTGKYYIEVLHQADITAIGVVSSAETNYSSYAGTRNAGIQYLTSGSMIIGNTSMTQSPGSAPYGTVVGMAVDLDMKTLRFLFKTPTGNCGILGSSYSFATGLFPTNPAAFLPALSLRASGANNKATMNFGQNTFTCPVPSGYKAGWF